MDPTGGPQSGRLGAPHTAADAGQVEAGLAGLAGRLCPVVAVAGTSGDAAGWATGWLQAHDRWLLILDNVEDPADIEPLLGQLGGGHMIVTSRRVPTIS